MIIDSFHDLRMICAQKIPHIAAQYQPFFVIQRWQRPVFCPLSLRRFNATHIFYKPAILFMLGFALSLLHGNCQTWPKDLSLLSLKLRHISADLIFVYFATIPRKSYHDLFHQVWPSLAGQVSTGRSGLAAKASMATQFRAVSNRRPQNERQ